MASNFPSSLDAFTNPTSADAMDSVSGPHATQHSDLNDAVEALQAKVGADSSAVTSSLDYKVAQLEGQGAWTSFTPTWINLTQGNGTVVYAKYSQINKTVHFAVNFIWGSTTSLSGHWGMQLPVTAAHQQSLGLNSALLSDWGTTVYWGKSFLANTTDLYFYSDKVLSSNYVYYEAVSATAPFTWTGTVSDAITFQGTYEAA